MAQHGRTRKQMNDKQKEKTLYECFGKINGVKIFNSTNFDYDFFKTCDVCKIPKGNKLGRYKKRVLDVLLSFDIETSTLEKYEQSFMYVWQLGINFDMCIIGRTWREFKYCLLEISKQIPDKHIVKIFVHNLAFEFSFLKGIYRFNPDDVFILDGRRVARCTMLNNIEFDCSYIQANMSLAMLTDYYKVEHNKQSGSDFDYSKIRYSDTELSFEELQYCVHDVIGLNEAIAKRMESYNDNLFTIPLTSTGYVRRDIKKAMQNFSYNHLMDLIPDFSTYEILENAFRGGNTHANRLFTNKILDGGITSFDIQSSYPYQMVCKKYPMHKWHTWETEKSEETYLFLKKQGNALLVVVELYNVRLQNPLYGAPYIAVHKCMELSQPVEDNGRVLECSYCKLALTDVDMDIIRDIYTFDIEYVDIRFSKYDYLPKEITDKVLEYFKNKTELKGVGGADELYMKSKALLNSIYGMMAQKPVKQNIDFLIDEEYQFNLQNEDRETLYNKYLKNPYTSYAWGTWVTAHARKDLHDGIALCGNKFIYCDTDCCKFFTDDNIIKSFNERNEEIKKIAIKRGAVAIDAKGRKQCLGVWDFDGECDRFITMGAKKYAQEKNGEIKLTVAGVNKKDGAKELQELGGLEVFKDGLIFKKSGGVEAVYNDRVCRQLEHGGRKLLITDNVCLMPSTYTLGLTDEYRFLLMAEQHKRY